MRRISLFLCFLLSLASYGAQRYHLVRIVVTGSNRYSQEDLARATGLKANSQVTLEDLQQAGSRLGNCGAFSSVQFQYKPGGGSADAVQADFQVKDADKFLPAVFDNVIWSSDAELQRALHDEVPLFNGSLPLSGTLPDDLKAALSRVQVSKGLPADVSYMLAGELGQPPSAYRFKIENANLKIRDFRFSGAGHLPPGALAEAVAAARGTDYLRTDAAKMLSASLLPLYRDRGYLQAAIGEVRASLEDGGVVIAASITEGAQYRLAGFTWSGNTVVSSADLSRLITMKPGETVNSGKLRYDLAQAKKLFLKFGREAATITPVATFSADTVSYVFSVREGDLYRMGELEIEGFDADTTSKLRANWKLAPGAPYDNTYLVQFLFHTLPLSHGHQKNWAIVEQIDDPQKTVNVHLQFRGD